MCQAKNRSAGLFLPRAGGLRAVLLAFAIALSGAPVSGGQDDALHACGWSEPSPETLARLAGRFFDVDTSPTRAPLPARVVNTLHLPKVASQGQLGICGSYAVFYYLKTYQEARLHGWQRPDPEVDPEHVSSPAWGVLAAPHGVVDGRPWGAHSGEAIEFICDYGSLTWAEMPYADTMDVTVMPTAAMMRSSLRWKGLAGGRISGINTASGLTALKRHLAAGDIAVGAWPSLYWNFERYPDGGGISNGVYYRTADGLSRNLGHALTVVGYDDDREYVDDRTGGTRRGALLLVNSWGTTWGVEETSAGTRGFMWLAYDAVLAGQLGGEVYVMVSRGEDYQPGLLATLRLEDADGDWMLPVPPAPWPRFLSLAGDGVSAAGRFPGNDYNVGGNTAEGALELLVDLSFMAGSVFPTLEFNGNYLAGGVVGTIAGIAVERSGAPPSALPGLPVDIKQFSSSYPVFRHHLAMLGTKEVGLDGLHPTTGSAAWGDANGDGHPDLAVSVRQSEGSRLGSILNALYVNDGSGQFAAPAILPGSELGELAWADLDNDGDLDLVLGSLTETRILENTGGGGFSMRPGGFPAACIGGLAVADFDRDGRADIALLNPGAGVIILRQMPDAAFETIVLGRAVTGSQDSALAAGDIDGDGLPDLVSASGSGMFDKPGLFLLHRNLGNLAFATLDLGIPALVAPALACGDFDGDGYDDIAYSGASSVYAGGQPEIGILRGQAAGLPVLCAIDPDFAAVYRGRLAWVDIDNDGARDLVASGRETNPGSVQGYTSSGYPLDLMFSNRTRVLHRQADGMFAAAAMNLPGTSGNLGPSFLAVRDIDGDGDADILSGGCHGGASDTWVNAGGPPASTTAAFLLDNRATDYFGRQRPNAAPTAPVTLGGSLTAPGKVRFTWSGATDDRTPQNGLRYVLRVGTAPGAGDAASGAVAPDANGLLVQSGVTLNELPAGTLHWSVRTVDGGLAVSPWSAEQTVVVANYAPAGRLEILAAPVTGGTTEPVPGIHRPGIGSVFNVLAKPAAGHRFAGWQGASAGADPALALAVTGNQTLTAGFAPATVTPPSPDWVRVAVSYTAHPWYVWGNYSHVAAVFGGALLVIPGWGYNMNDRWWYSTNGSSWTRSSQVLTDSCGIREGAAGVVFNNRLWIFGGYDFGYGADRPDIWSASSSSAGNLTWRKDAATAPWPGRRNAGCAVFNGKLWLVGGRESFGSGMVDVWSSANGTTWNREPDAPWTARSRVRLVVHNGKMLALLPGGGAGVPPAVWETGNGTVWTLLTDAAPWAADGDFSAAVFDGRIHAVFSPDQAWSSPDGAFWVRNRPSDDQLAHWGSRSGMELVVYNNQLWLTGGINTSNGEFDVDVWRLPVNTTPSPLGVLAMAVSPAAGGTTMPPPGQHTDFKGATYPVAALANPGWRFAGWQGPVAAADSAATTVTLTESVTLTALFSEDDTPDAEPPPPVTVDLVISPAAGGVANSATHFAVPAGTRLTPSVAARDGYRFSHWQGPVAAPLLATTPLTATANTVLTAHFVPARPCLVGGRSHSAFRNADGSVWGWGGGDAGQFGDPWQPGPGGMPSLASFTGATVLAGSDDALYATTSDKRVWRIGTAAAFLADVSAFFAGFGSQATILTAFGEREFRLYGNLQGSDYIFPELPRHEYARVAVGPAHALGLGGDGRLRGFGANGNGQIGDGTTNYSADFQVIGGIPDFVEVAAGGTAIAGFSFGIDRNGRVWGWGANGRGQLGLGTPGDDVRTPQRLDTLPEAVIALAAGEVHILALAADGRVFAWGANDAGQLGDGTDADSATPIQVGGLPPVAGIAAGTRHSLACATDGCLFAWGANDRGQVTGVAGADVLAPVPLPGLIWGQAATTLTLGVAGGGYDGAGRGAPEGIGSIDPPPGSYTARPGGVVTLRAADGERYVFDHWTGPVAHPDQPLTYVLTEQSATVTAVFRLRGTTDATLAIAVSPAAGGTTSPAPGSYSHPRDSVVQLAAYPAAQYQFQDWLGNAGVPGATQAATEITMTRDWEVTARFVKRSLRVRPLYCVGGRALSTAGIFGTGLNPSGIRYVDVVYAGQYLALAETGSMLAWGANGNGQCGTGTAGGTVAAPTPVVGPSGEPPFADVDMIGAAVGLSAARRRDGSLWAWGRLPGTDVDQPRPVRVMDGGGQPLAAAGLADMAGAGDTLLLLYADRTVRSWGSQYTGVSGRGAAPHTVPTRVPVLDGAIALATGDNFALALKQDGSVWSWGDNGSGQLGAGSGVAAREVPAAIAGLPAIAKIFAGSKCAAALDTQGRLWVWGENAGYDLGLGDVLGAAARDNQFLPVLNTSAPANIVDLFFAFATGYAVTADGKLWSWGFNGAGLAVGRPSQVIGVNLGDVTPPVYRLLSFTVDPACAHLTGFAAGAHFLMAGQSVELWARSDEEHAFQGWKLDGVAVGGDRLSVTMNADHAVEALFAPVPPLLVIGDAAGVLGETVRIPVHLERTAQTFEGMDFTVSLPPPFTLEDVELDPALAEGQVAVMWRTETVARGDKTNTRILVFHVLPLLKSDVMGLMHLLCRIPADAPTGSFPVGFAAGGRADGGAVLARDDGTVTVAAATADGTLTVSRPYRAEGCLIFATGPAAADVLSDDEFAALPAYAALRNDLPCRAELWLRLPDGEEMAGFYGDFAATGATAFADARVGDLFLPAGGAVAPDAVTGLAGLGDPATLDERSIGAWIKAAVFDLTPGAGAAAVAATWLSVNLADPFGGDPVWIRVQITSPVTVAFAPNHAPTLPAASFATPANRFVLVDLSPSDADAQDAGGLEVVILTPPGGGAFTPDPDRPFTWRYQPEAGFAGTVSFEFQASDGTAASPVQTGYIHVCQTATVHLASGWAAFTPPGTLPDPRVEAFAATASRGAPAVWAGGPAWMWNGPGQHWQAATTLEAHTPAWLPCALGGDVVVETLPSPFRRAMHRGWNTLGVPSPLPVLPAMAAVWEFHDGVLKESPGGTLSPGIVYWILWAAPATELSEENWP